MRIENRVALTLLIFPLYFASTEVTSTAAVPSSHQQLEKLQQEKEIRDRVEIEVDRAFDKTTTLLNILLMIIAAVPIVSAVFVWLFRRSK